MNRYHLLIGTMKFRNMEVPVIRCSIIAESEEFARAIAEFMGFKIFTLAPEVRTPIYENYQLN